MNGGNIRSNFSIPCFLESQNMIAPKYKCKISTVHCKLFTGPREKFSSILIFRIISQCTLLEPVLNIQMLYIRYINAGKENSKYFRLMTGRFKCHQVKTAF